MLWQLQVGEPTVPPTTPSLYGVKYLDPLKFCELYKYIYYLYNWLLQLCK